MVRQHFKGNILLSNSNNSFLVHVRIMNSHTTENGKSLDEILVVLREWQIVEFIYQLYDSYNLAGGILNCHAKYSFMFEICALVDAWIESGILVGIWYVNSLPGGCHVTRDPYVNWKSTFERTGPRLAIIAD